MTRFRKEKEYAAFISYRHLSPDKEIAQALHWLLEHNMIRPDKSVPRNIRKVFLDVGELPILEDLDQGILDALDKSECLFVICSPDLPKSKYCMREIAYFKERHGGSLNRIYTLLVDGTPEESFPQSLRTATKRITDPDGTQQEIQADAEPLFADVRGKSLYHSLWKLVKSEYLRLAAAYYGCSYDSLYKRRRRWLCKVGAGLTALAVALGVGFHTYAKTRDVQFRTAQAESAASYAMEQLEKNDELLALTLLTGVAFERNDFYTSVLRSAVVDHDYKKNGAPVAAVLQVPYEYSGETVCYQSKTGERILMYDNYMVKIIDAKTGEVLLEAAKDRFFVLGDMPDSYLILHSHEDEAGVMCDYVSLYDIVDNSLIREFSFRESDPDSPNYRMVRDPSVPHLLTVKDGDAYVAFLTAEGIQLSREEFIRQAEAYVDVPVTAVDVPFRVTKNKFFNRWEVKDPQGAVLFQIGKNCGCYAFSSDWSRFAWSDEAHCFIYETDTWTALGELSLEDERLQKLSLLPGSTYLIANYGTEGGDLSIVTDWQTGRELLRCRGSYMLSLNDRAFFVTGAGTLTRYDYTALDMTRWGRVVAYNGSCSLSLSEGSCMLLKGDQGNILLETSCDGMPAWDDTLAHILVATDGKLYCYDTAGKTLWSQEDATAMTALSPDGTLAAWLGNDGTVFVADADTGAVQYEISVPSFAQAGDIWHLALSRQGLCVLGSKDTLWIAAGQTEYVSLGEASDVRLYGDDILILENEYARFYDLQVYDVSADPDRICRPDENTAVWAYRPESGYLVRQLETGTFRAGLELEILRRRGDSFEPIGTITLPQSDVEGILFDSSGQWLTVFCGGTLLYRMEDLVKCMDTDCFVYYEDDMLYGVQTWGQEQYSIPMGDVQQLYCDALDMLTGASAVRQMSQEEKEIYAIQD